jgi:hypothetical protein
MERGGIRESPSQVREARRGVSGGNMVDFGRRARGARVVGMFLRTDGDHSLSHTGTRTADRRPWDRGRIAPDGEPNPEPASPLSGPHTCQTGGGFGEWIKPRTAVAWLMSCSRRHDRSVPSPDRAWRGGRAAARRFAYPTDTDYVDIIEVVEGAKADDLFGADSRSASACAVCAVNLRGELSETGRSSGVESGCSKSS